jgi:hypothetical protein
MVIIIIISILWFQKIGKFSKNINNFVKSKLKKKQKIVNHKLHKRKSLFVTSGQFFPL